MTVKIGFWVISRCFLRAAITRSIIELSLSGGKSRTSFAQITKPRAKMKLQKQLQWVALFPDISWFHWTFIVFRSLTVQIYGYWGCVGAKVNLFSPCFFFCFVAGKTCGKKPRRRRKEKDYLYALINQIGNLILWKLFKMISASVFILFYCSAAFFLIRIRIQLQFVCLLSFSHRINSCRISLQIISWYIDAYVCHKFIDSDFLNSPLKRLVFCCRIYFLNPIIHLLGRKMYKQFMLFCINILRNPLMHM